ncbi:protein BTG1 isoform X2 [Halyomorpha halys]|uniref:protein BTG1 isoform X2 n=1 Tax=Halyomorpha halys TaxID=286706 RepID=UPI000D0C88F6|nr:protein BTG3 isoform X2 [Halyomorpha halys]
MRDEISAAVVFLVRLIEKSENFNREQLEHFKDRLSELLLEKFENHWFPEKPDKGQGYRCIRVNGVNRRDETLEQAAIACGIRYEDMKLPFELTIWVDPNEVCCRFGENKGSFCTLASFSDKESIGSSSGSEDSLSEDSVKETPSPLSTPVKQTNQGPTEIKTRRNGQQQQIQHGGRGRRGSLYPQHPLNAWYSLISPPWLPPSPPPYTHPAYRHKWPPHRYSSPPKPATLKV